LSAENRYELSEEAYPLAALSALRKPLICTLRLAEVSNNRRVFPDRPTVAVSGDFLCGNQGLIPLSSVRGSVRRYQKLAKSDNYRYRIETAHTGISGN
jgi:hypothetical protein